MRYSNLLLYNPHRISLKMTTLATTTTIVDAEHVEFADLKAKVIVDHVEIDVEPQPPVADDFMYDFKYNHPLPTSKVLGIEIPATCDASKEASQVVRQLSEAMGAGDAEAFADLFLPYGEYSALAGDISCT